MTENEDIESYLAYLENCDPDVVNKHTSGKIAASSNMMGKRKASRQDVSLLSKSQNRQYVTEEMLKHSKQSLVQLILPQLQHVITHGHTVDTSSPSAQTIPLWLFSRHDEHSSDTQENLSFHLIMLLEQYTHLAAVPSSDNISLNSSSDDSVELSSIADPKKFGFYEFSTLSQVELRMNTTYHSSIGLFAAFYELLRSFVVAVSQPNISPNNNNTIMPVIFQMLFSSDHNHEEKDKDKDQDKEQMLILVHILLEHYETISTNNANKDELSSPHKIIYWLLLLLQDFLSTPTTVTTSTATTTGEVVDNHTKLMVRGCHALFQVIHQSCIRIGSYFPSTVVSSRAIVTTEMSTTTTTPETNEKIIILLMEELSQLLYLYQLLQYLFYSTLIKHLSASSTVVSAMDWYSDCATKLFTLYKSLLPMIAYVLKTGLFVIAIMLQRSDLLQLMMQDDDDEEEDVQQGSDNRLKKYEEDYLALIQSFPNVPSRIPSTSTTPPFHLGNTNAEEAKATEEETQREEQQQQQKKKWSYNRNSIENQRVLQALEIDNEDEGYDFFAFVTKEQCVEILEGASVGNFLLRPPESFLAIHSNATSSATAITNRFLSKFSMTDTKEDKNTFILSFRAPNNAHQVASTGEGTIDQRHPLVKHAVIRRELLQKDVQIQKVSKPMNSNMDFDVLDDEEDGIVQQVNTSAKSSKQHNHEYVYKCGKLGPYASLLQILRYVLFIFFDFYFMSLVILCLLMILGKSQKSFHSH